MKRTIYQKMMKFAEGDPDVISLDPEVHLKNVLTGSYAFFGEGAALELWASRHCQIMVIPDNIYGNTRSYNVFTPKNSLLVRKIDTV